MIKEKIFEYLKEYFQEYLFGFDKSKFDIGVSNGRVTMSDVNIKPEKINPLLINKEIPFLIKCGKCLKINIECSVMNFIAEKPVDINIDNFEFILKPSNAHIDKLKSIKAEKEVIDYDIRKKIKFFENFVKHEKNFEFFAKFFFEKIFMIISKKIPSINLSCTYIVIKFEDDQIIFHPNMVNIGVRCGNFKFKIINDGINNKKINFKCVNFTAYIKEKEKEENIFDEFSFEGDFSSKPKNGVIDFTKESSYNVLITIALGEIKANILPRFLSIITELIEFVNNFRIINIIRKFRPQSIKKANNFIRYVMLYVKAKKYFKASSLYQEFNRFLGVAGLNKEKQLEEDIQIVKQSIMFNADPINLNENIKEKIEENKNDLSKEIVINFEIIANKITTNFYDNDYNRKLCLCLQSPMITLRLTNESYVIIFTLAKFTLETAESYLSTKGEVPHFQFRYNDYRENPTTNVISQEQKIKNFYLQNCAGLKEQELFNDSYSVQKSKEKIYFEAARREKKLRILSHTLNIETKSNSAFKSKNYNPKYEIEKQYYRFNTENFINSLISSNRRESNAEDDLKKMQKNRAVSNAIKDYNSQKLKISTIFDNSRSKSRNNFNAISTMQNNSELYPLRFLVVKNIKISFELQPKTKNPNQCVINISETRVNLFKDYLSSIFSFMKSFDIQFKEPFPNKFINDHITSKKYMYILKKNLYERIINNNCVPKTYFSYLHEEIQKFPFTNIDFASVEANYLFSYYFSQSLEINFKNENFDFILYQAGQNLVNIVLSHIKIPKSVIKFYIALSYFYAKIFDAEIEANEYNSIRDIIEYVVNEIKLKFSSITKLIEPMLKSQQTLEEEVKKKNEEQKYQFNTTFASPKYNFSLAQSKGPFQFKTSNTYK